MSRGRKLGPRPDPLPLSERVINYCWRAPLFFGATGLFGSLALGASLVEKNGRRQHRIAQAWAQVCTWSSGAKVSILNRERLTGETAVYVCNHLSYMDTPVIFGSLPFQFRIVARHDLWKMPFIGWYLRRSGQVPVDVDDPRASIASLVSAVRTLKAGMPLFIFPEGGRTETGHPTSFMKGPAFMAIRAQVPLVPMALIGTWELLPMGTAEFHPVPVTLAVGEPIETQGKTTKELDQVTARLEEQISGLYYEHSWMERAGSPAEGRSPSGPAAVTNARPLSQEYSKEASRP